MIAFCHVIILAAISGGMGSLVSVKNSAANSVAKAMAIKRQ
jgi:hypothetical protein